MEPWLFYALLSAVSAAFVSIFGKVGLQGIDSNVATAVRAVIMAVFLIGVVFVQATSRTWQRCCRTRRVCSSSP